MDQLCIDRGTLLDNPSVKTLENPGVHTIHCLIDIRACIDSGFSILAPPTTPGGLYTVRYQLGVEGTQLAVRALEEARKNGVKSGFSMNVTGIDDGTSELKCITTSNAVSPTSPTNGITHNSPFPSATALLLFLGIVSLF
jgi:hypothetical protein